MTERCCGNCVFALTVQNAGAEEAFVCVSHPDARGAPILVCTEGCCPRFEARPEPVVRPEPGEPPDAQTALIPLTQNKVALVDVADFEWLSQFKWHAKKLGGNFYACRHEKGRTILMHREIMQPPPGMIVDHIKSDTLDNRRRRLRVCTQGQNRANSRPHGGRCPYKGVYPQGDKWYGVVECKGKQHYVGTFDTPEEAARARDRMARQLFGKYAWLNFPDEVRYVDLSGTIHLRVRLKGDLTDKKEE